RRSLAADRVAVLRREDERLPLGSGVVRTPGRSGIIEPMKVILTLTLLAAASQASDWTQLFNRRDLTGWNQVGPGRFVVEPDGTMKTEGGMGLLWYTGEKFGNCTLRVVFKTIDEHGNSGLYIRLPEEPKDPWYAVHNGY